ncbi:hypothetical protein Tco_1324689, partial [Tanacetum coccineum]
MITTVFATTNPENTPFAYCASTLANLNPMISPAFVEENYEDYNEERKREMEPRPEPNREATPTLRLRSLVVRRQQERVVGFEESPNRVGSRGGRNAKGRNESGQPLQSSLTFVHGGHQPLTNIGGIFLLMVISYSQPSAGIINGQTLNFPFQGQIGNPPTRGISTYHSQGGGYTPQTFTNNSLLSYNRSMYPAVTDSINCPFYTQPMYAPPNMSVYQNPAGSFTDSIGFVTPFVHWIEDYPLLDGPKRPSYIGSYDGKGDPNNFLYLFEGAIRCLHEEQLISGFVHGLRTKSLVEHLSTYLLSTYKDHGHDTNDCLQLRNQIEEAMKSGQLSLLVKGIKKERVKAF